MAQLYKAAGDTSSFVREAVAESVPPDGQGLEVLLALSKDEIAQVRAAAARGLAASKDDRAQRRRTELKSDPEKVVRQAAGG
jgi:HEAT repeat protein